MSDELTHQDGSLLDWLRNRLVNVYGESFNADFVQSLERVRLRIHESVRKAHTPVTAGTKVYTSLTAPDDIGLVTHADYMALEDENRSLRASFDEAHQLWVKAAEELASIKARVESMQDRIDAYQEKGLAK